MIIKILNFIVDTTIAAFCFLTAANWLASDSFHHKVAGAMFGMAGVVAAIVVVQGVTKK